MQTTEPVCIFSVRTAECDDAANERGGGEEENAARAMSRQNQHPQNMYYIVYFGPSS